jgi:hypothetical protein
MSEEGRIVVPAKAGTHMWTVKRRRDLESEIAGKRVEEMNPKWKDHSDQVF